MCVFVYRNDNLFNHSPRYTRTVSICVRPISHTTICAPCSVNAYMPVILRRICFRVSMYIIRSAFILRWHTIKSCAKTSWSVSWHWFWRSASFWQRCFIKQHSFFDVMLCICSCHSHVPCWFTATTGRVLKLPPPHPKPITIFLWNNKRAGLSGQLLFFFLLFFAFLPHAGYTVSMDWRSSSKFFFWLFHFFL